MFLTGPAKESPSARQFATLIALLMMVSKPKGRVEPFRRPKAEDCLSDCHTFRQLSNERSVDYLIVLFNRTSAAFTDCVLIEVRVPLN